MVAAMLTAGRPDAVLYTGAQPAAARVPAIVRERREAHAVLSRDPDGGDPTVLREGVVDGSRGGTPETSRSQLSEYQLGGLGTAPHQHDRVHAHALAGDGKVRARQGIADEAGER